MSAVEKAIECLKNREAVLLLDDLSNQWCAYLLYSARDIDADRVCQLVNIAGGLTLAAGAEEHLSFLNLKPMLGSSVQSAPDLTVSVEARHGVTTGISASDRAKTLSVLSSTTDPRRDLVTPGHIFPIIAKKGGVLTRHGAAEAAVDLMHLADCGEVAAMSHCLDENGEVRNAEESLRLAEKHSLISVRIGELIEYLLIEKPTINKTASSLQKWLPAFDLECHCFTSTVDGSEHLAFKKLRVDGAESEAGEDKPKATLVRVQSERLFDDVLGVNIVPHRHSLASALNVFSSSSREGVLVYIRHPKNQSLKNVASTLMNHSTSSETSTETSQLRELGIGAQILRQLGISNIELLSNSSRALSGLEPYGIRILGRMEY